MGFLDDIKNKAGELGDKAGDAFEVAKDKAGDLVDAAKDKLDTDDDRVTGGGDAPADQVAAAPGGAVGGAPSAGTEYTTPSVEPLGEVAADPLAPDLVADEAVFTENVAVDPIATPLDESVDSAGATEDEALADLQAKAEDLRSDNA